MRPLLFQRRLIWWPTIYGWIMLGLFALTPPLLWWFQGESFLATTSQLDADVLVVEGWISLEGVRAAALEFKRGNYRYVVATGGLTGESWSNRRWSYAVEAHEQLVRAGIPSDQVILAESRERETQRTYEMALSAWAGLQSRHIEVTAVNVFTRGAHARRSRLVFKKVLPANCDVGVISWTSENLARQGWWRSSERSEDMIKESVGYLFELLLNSGRNVARPTATMTGFASVNQHAIRPPI